MTVSARGITFRLSTCLLCLLLLGLSEVTFWYKPVKVEMRIIRSPDGQEEGVIVRRSESVDAQGIDSLIGPPALTLFGRVNVIHLLYDQTSLYYTVQTVINIIIIYPNICVIILISLISLLMFQRESQSGCDSGH